jgi:hypothetical protein
VIALIALIFVGVLVPWVVLFLLWRWLRTDAIQRLRRARLFVAACGAVGVLIAYLRHDVSGAVIAALGTLLMIAVLSGWLRRVLMAVAILFLIFGACAGWLAFGSIHGVMTTPGGSILGWVSVALTTLLTWLLLGVSALCLWLARRPLIPLRSASPSAPPPPTPHA